MGVEGGEKFKEKNNENLMEKNQDWKISVVIHQKDLKNIRVLMLVYELCLVFGQHLWKMTTILC